MTIKSILFAFCAITLSTSFSIERINCAQNSESKKPALCVACKTALVDGKCPNCAKCKTCKKSLKDCTCKK